ncbi:DUF5949 family protein [Streptomyces sp. NPDC096040]|uniref:DUF5949 family protein n=1 Tax=Streptomyces sp. NPDC096040 TaxID=3155541 RepID=UPI0033240790
MTSTPSETRPFWLADLGTVAEGGAEATSAAVEALPGNIGLPIGGDLVDRAARPGLPVTLLAPLKAQYPAPEETLTAAAQIVLPARSLRG